MSSHGCAEPRVIDINFQIKNSVTIMKKKLSNKKVKKISALEEFLRSIGAKKWDGNPIVVGKDHLFADATGPAGKDGNLITMQLGLIVRPFKFQENTVAYRLVDGRVFRAKNFPLLVWYIDREYKRLYISGSGEFMLFTAVATKEEKVAYKLMNNFGPK